MPSPPAQGATGRPVEGAHLHTIFLVHGMGEFTARWSQSIQADIRKNYDATKYRFLADFPFDETFRFAEITYDPFFVEYLTEAKNQANQLAKWSKLAANLPGG